MKTTLLKTKITTMKKTLLLLICLPMIGFGQNVNIPDPIFKAYLLSIPTINTSGDTEIQLSEATAYNVTINVSGLGISDLTGIEEFTNLAILNCTNNSLTSLDVSGNTALQKLYCGNNLLTSLDVSNNTNLTDLACWNNQLTNLDVSNNTNLTDLYCVNNQLTSLDVSNNTVLRDLYCSYNQLTSLNTFGNSLLVSLYCSDNQLTSLDVTSNSNLSYLHCPNNQITTLDVTSNTSLMSLNCNSNFLTCLDLSQNPLDCLFVANNLLEQLNIKNGITGANYWWPIDATNNNLTCIEANNVTPSTNASVDNGVVFNTNCNYINPCWLTTTIQDFYTNKQPIQRLDILGRETKQKNQLLFYIYDDGTVEKKMVIK